STTTSTVAAASPTVLQNFEVAQPVLLPYGPADSDGSTPVETSAGSCTVLLMRHDFAFSYGSPFVGNYTPPSCQFNRVAINFTVVSQGRQYDRLALMYLGDFEVWRTSTAEPVVPPGIRWTYLKDMTEYLSLWKKPQTIIFDLGNLVNDKYTGIFNTTLTATFFTAPSSVSATPPSDLIIPISARQGANNAVSQFTVPGQNATNTISNFPRNARRAVFSISANGQSSEEFWWSNVPQSDTLTFNSTAGQLPGYSPFREVQLLIDGQLAGVQWPFPVIFTGGVSPALHRPIASPDAFDLKEHEIDITPFLPLLCDGAQHTFTIQIAGLNGETLTQTVGENWYVTGKIFVWLDDDAKAITTGDRPTVQGGGPSVTVSRSVGQTANGTNETLAYDTAVRRSLVVTGRVVTKKSSKQVSWTQTLSYANKGLVSGFGYNQLNDMTISGADVASGVASYKTAYRYPLLANSTYSVSEQGNLTIFGHVVQGKRVQTTGAAVFPSGLEAFATAGGKKYVSSLLDTTKSGSAYFFQTGDGRNSSGFGDAVQVFTFTGYTAGGGGGQDLDVDGGAGTELYFRNVSAVNNTIVFDYKKLAGRVVGGGGGHQGQGQ
ncbi:peptide N-acetyl-beta-D-glucosaminyl asparaginase amidase A-domain-containing protein, partial [Bombardia bombarda]